MSEIEEITVVIKADGTLSIEVDGVAGPRCLSVTEELEKDLGGAVLKRVHKDSFHQTAGSQTSRQEQRRE